MRLTAIYDNGGKTLDRYTVITDQLHNQDLEQYEALALNTGGDGFSQWTIATPGRRLGALVKFEDLDEATQAHIARRIFGE